MLAFFAINLNLLAIVLDQGCLLIKFGLTKLALVFNGLLELIYSFLYHRLIVLSFDFKGENDISDISAHFFELGASTLFTEALFWLAVLTVKMIT